MTILCQLKKKSVTFSLLNSTKISSKSIKIRKRKITKLRYVPIVLGDRNYFSDRSVSNYTFMIDTSDWIALLWHNKNCNKFLITSTSVITKAIVKIVERMKSYFHFQLKLLSLQFSYTRRSYKKFIRTFSSTYSSSYITSIAFAIFSIFIIRYRSQFIDATKDVHKSIFFNYLVFLFFFSLISLRKHDMLYNKVHTYKASFIIIFIDAASASNLRNILDLREFLIEERYRYWIKLYLYLVQFISLSSLSITVNTLIFFSGNRNKTLPNKHLLFVAHGTNVKKRAVSVHTTIHARRHTRFFCNIK